jgi:hypothetical protein
MRNEKCVHQPDENYDGKNEPPGHPDLKSLVRKVGRHRVEPLFKRWVASAHTC